MKKIICLLIASIVFAGIHFGMKSVENMKSIKTKQETILAQIK